MLILHTHEFGPPVLLRDELHHGELVRPHGAGSDVPHLAQLDEIVQRLHGLFDRGRPIEAMNLEEIDVIGVQSLQTRVDGVEDTLAGQTTLVDIVNSLVNVLEAKDLRVVRLARSAATFGADDELMARDGELLDGFANQTLGVTVAVNVGCVPCIEPAIVGRFEQRESLHSAVSIQILERKEEGVERGLRLYLFFLNDPVGPLTVSYTHCAQDGDRDPQTRSTELAVLGFEGQIPIDVATGNLARVAGILRHCGLTNNESRNIEG